MLKGGDGEREREERGLVCGEGEGLRLGRSTLDMGEEGAAPAA